MSKIIKGYLTNFSEDKNFTAESQGYISAMEALAAKQAFENSIKARLDWNRTQEGKATPAERKLHAIPPSVRKYVPEDYTYAGGNGQVDEGTGLAPLGIGLGALAGAAALGYGAYRLAKKKAELKANGYYAFDNEITKEKCRNIDNPARTRAQLRKQYPNSRIIKGNTAYQLNPQEFKVAANFSQENFAELEAPSFNANTGLDNLNALSPANRSAVESARKADSLDQVKNLTAYNPRYNADSIHADLNKTYRSGESMTPNFDSLREYNKVVNKEKSGETLSPSDRAFAKMISKAVAANEAKKAEVKKLTEPKERKSLKARDIAVTKQETPEWMKNLNK